MALLRSEADDDQLAGLNVFLNSRGQQWTVNAMRLRMTRLKRRLKLADDLCPYLARHAFGTAAVINGVDPLTVATLLGHTSLEMVSKVYVHLAGERQHLSQAAERAAKSLADSRPRPTVPGSIA
jgi:site-specific recombinase XerD